MPCKTHDVNFIDKEIIAFCALVLDIIDVFHEVISICLTSQMPKLDGQILKS